MLENIGIYGWRSIEPIILAAMAVKKPILLIGTHGACKTDGAIALIKSVAGADAKVQKYDTPALQADEMLGYLNVKDLAEGRPAGYISTPISIWGMTGVILDEITRAHLMIQNKVIEVAREATVMGMETGVQYVFATANPPEHYGAMYMELALASRFICVHVPDFPTFTNKQLDTILQTKINVQGNEYLGLMEKARLSALPTDDQKILRQFVIQIAKVLQEEISTGKGSPGYSVRSMKMMYSLLEAIEKLKRISKNEYASLLTSQTLPDAILATVPEVWGITQKSVSKEKLKTKLRSLLVDFNLGNKINLATDLEDLLALDFKNTDIYSWGNYVVSKIKEIADETQMRHALGQTTKKLPEIQKDVANTILKEELLKAESLGMLPHNYPLTNTGMITMIQQVFERQ